MQIKEAYKLVVYPHGKVKVSEGVFVYKYLIGGVLLSEQEIPMKPETIIMDSSSGGELTDVIAQSVKFSVSHPVGDISSAVMLLGCLTPDHRNVKPQ